MSNGIIIFLLVCFFVVALSGKSGKKSRNLTKKSDVDVALGAVRVPSQSDPAVHYMVYPDLIRCSCPDWEKKRSDKEFLGRPERVCKHLAQYYAEHPDDVPETLKPWQIFIESMAEKGWGLPTTNVVYIDDESLDGVVIDCYPYLSRGWVNVYIQSARFGYNPKEQRWAGGDEPIKSEEWLDVIEQMLHHLDPQTKMAGRGVRRTLSHQKDTLYLQVVEFYRMKRSAAVVDISKHFELPMSEAAQIVERMKREGDIPYDDPDIYAEAAAFCAEQKAVSVSSLQHALGMDFVTASIIADRIKGENLSADVPGAIEIQENYSPEEAHESQIFDSSKERRFSPEDEKLYEEVRDFFKDEEAISISLVNRRFKTGYNKAFRFVERIQEEKDRR